MHCRLSLNIAQPGWHLGGEEAAGDLEGGRLRRDLRVLLVQLVLVLRHVGRPSMVISLAAAQCNTSEWQRGDCDYPCS